MIHVTSMCILATTIQLFNKLTMSINHGNCMGTTKSHQELHTYTVHPFLYFAEYMRTQVHR